MKRCIDCSELLPLAEYNKKRSDCKACQSKRRSILENRWKECRRRARRENYAFELSLEKFDEQTKLPCYLCGGYAEEKDFSGIDRIDSEGGYTLNNIQPCCWKCNNMKSDHSLSGFLAHTKKIFWFNLKRRLFLS